jgi:hypothetical protein
MTTDTDTCADCGGSVEDDIMAVRRDFEKAFRRSPQQGPRCKACLLAALERDVSGGD